MALSFGPWRKGSADAEAMKLLFKQSSIFDDQKRDGDTREAIEGADFSGSYLALFITDGQLEGYVLYTPRPNGVYEQHTAFLPPYRGKYANGGIEVATMKMFMETSCSQIVTFCPEWIPQTRWLARHMGGNQLFRRERFALRDGVPQWADLYGQTALQWAWRNHMEFADVGEKWHDQVFAAIEPHHEEDPAHNGFLGLALEMGRRQPHKAAAIYAAWAELAGYEPGQLLWADGRGHSFVDFGTGVVLNGPDGVISVIPKCPTNPPAAPSR